MLLQNLSNELAATTHDVVYKFLFYAYQYFWSSRFIDYNENP